MNIIIPDDVIYIIDTLQSRGHEAFIVGGCVRDILMRRIPYDWDIATSALPHQIKSCFFHTYDTGIAHGTVTVVYDGKNYEITTYRVDGEYEDGRRPKSVSFTANLKDDLARRDFTMNALAWHPVCGLVDPYGGLNDIENHLIRGVGNAELRFREDALRMMRAVRFAAQLGFDISHETLAAIKHNAVCLRQISAERIRDELTKLLLSPHPEKVSLLLETGLINEGWPLPMKPEQAEIQNSIEILRRCPKEAALVYAVLFFNREPGDAYKTMFIMRFEKSLCHKTSQLIKWAKHPINNEDYALRKYLSRCNISYFKDILTLKQLMKTKDSHELPQILERYNRIIEDGDCLSIRNLQISGDDLLNMGFKGKAIGEALNRLMDLVLQDPSINNKTTLIQMICSHRA